MTGSLASYWRELASGRSRTFVSTLMRRLLAPPSVVYGGVQLLRRALYNLNILAVRRLPRPVVSVGNITVGGTGKTPVTIWIARYLLERGYRVTVLSRGYGGTREGGAAVVSDGSRCFLTAEECGDEPFMLAAAVPGLSVVIGASRYEAGCLALQKCAPDIFLLDDGFQHIRLHRDLNILLLDARNPYGNGWCLPAGMLREPINAAEGADIVILTRADVGSAATSTLPNVPTCRSRHELSCLIPLTGGEPVSYDSMQNVTVAAFAGIAEPRFFFDGLKQRGLHVTAELSLTDHATYDNSGVRELENFIRTSGAAYAVTTEKDAVKLGGMAQDLAEKTLIARLDLIFDDPAPLTSLLLNLL